MSRLMFVLAALLFSASLAAAPPPDRTAVQGARSDGADYAAEKSRNESADDDEDSDEDDSDKESDNDTERRDGVSDNDADEEVDDDTDRNVSRHRTRAEYVRHLRAKAHRIAVRRVAVAHHRRSYVHQRYLRKPGPFYRPTYRRQRQSSEDDDD